MRCWHPFSDGAALAVKAFRARQIVLLPLYPQYSTTTTASSLKDWDRAARKAGLAAPTHPHLLLSRRAGFYRRRGGKNPRSDGRPDAGSFLSPAVVGARPAQAHHCKRRSLSMAGGTHRRGPCGCAGDRRIWTGQSVTRAGWGRWNGSEPATDAEIRRAGREGKGVIVAPIAFVSEHSETLVELDIEYAKACAPRRACRIIAAPPRWAPIRISSPGWPDWCARAAWPARLSTAAMAASVRRQFCRCGYGRDD